MRSSDARYDGHADWYDAWAAHGLEEASSALAELVPVGSGVAVEVGCGTGRNAALLSRRGFQVVGLDVSVDQLTVARPRMRVLRASGRSLPLADGVAQLVVAVLVSTDVEDYRSVVAEGMRVLRPGGWFVHLGVHPCFRSPFVETHPEGLLLHRGYERAGWAPETPWTGNTVRARVGVHHLPMADLLHALLHPRGVSEEVIERGDHSGLPWMFGIRLRRLP